MQFFYENKGWELGKTLFFNCFCEGENQEKRKIIISILKICKNNEELLLSKFRKVSKSFEKFRSFEHSLSETELATVCQKVLPNRTEPNFRSITTYDHWMLFN